MNNFEEIKQEKTLLPQTSSKKKYLLTGVIIVIILGIAIWGWFILQSHPLFSSLHAPKKPIEEVIIRSYGNIPSDLLESVKSVVEEKIGVRAYIDSPRPSFRNQTAYYNPQRDQYDGDRIWDTERAFAYNFPTKRLIMIIDVDIYTKIQPKRLYILSRASSNINAILISIYRLQMLSDDASNEVAHSELATARIQKLALQTLGVSVFLEGLFDYGGTNDASCVMYRGRILSELDKQGDDFCAKNKEKLKDYFVMNASK